MQQIVKELLKQYSAHAKEACRIILNNFGRTEIKDLLELRVHHPGGEFINNGINRFYFHGSGLNFKNDEFQIDWDFNGQEENSCCFDPWKIVNYIRDNKVQLPFEIDSNFLEKEFKSAVLSGEMQVRGNNYFYKLQKERKRGCRKV